MSDVSLATRDVIVPGAKLRRKFIDNTSQLWHVYQVIESEWIVFKRYDQKRGWEYFIVDIIECDIALANGGLTLK